MPYISKEPRFLMQEEIEALSLCISGSRETRPGELNYAISKLIKEAYGDGLRYADYNEIIGVLECCKLEFYRAQVAPYEDEKRKENGPV